MIAVVYAAPCALLIIWLSLNVIKLRHRERVNIGAGGCEELELAISTQSNAVEYIPIALLLLFALEINAAPLLLVHAFGLALLIGRVLHAHAMLRENLKNRVRGMQLTIWCIIGLVFANLVYVPYGDILAF